MLRTERLYAPRAGSTIGQPLVTNCELEDWPRRRSRSHAAELCLQPHGTHRTELRAGLPPGIDAEADAAARSVRRQVHDRLPCRVSGELVHAREALFKPS